MENEIAAISKAIRFCMVEPTHDEALEALTALETELTRLQSCALDLSVVPDGWGLSSACLVSETWSIWLRNGRTKDAANGLGNTPAEALAAAVKRIGG